MKRFSEQLKKKSNNIRLRASERSDLRGRLESYMEYHPLPADMKTVKKTPTKVTIPLGIVSEPFKAISLNMVYVRNFAGVFALFMVVGVPIVAEKSVPGDALYAVKTEITEEVRASLKRSPYAKLEWEKIRLERRITEARLLASEGKLTPEVQAGVMEAVKVHSDAAISEIALMGEGSESDAAIAKIAFASSLSVQSDMLEGVLGDNVNQEGEVTPGYSIADLATVLSDVSDEADVAQDDVTVSYATLLATAESDTTHAYELFQVVKNNASEKDAADIQRRLDDIERKIAFAIGQHDSPVAQVSDDDNSSTVSVASTSGNTASSSDVQQKEIDVEVQITEEINNQKDSVALLRVALTDVQKLIIFMTDINVRQNMSIEDLVPVTPTIEEETQAVVEVLDEVLKLQSDIEHKIIDEDSSEKTILGVEILSKQLDSVSELLESGNINIAQAVVNDAHEIAKDVSKMVDADITTEEKDVEESMEDFTNEVSTSTDSVSMPQR